MQCTLEGNNARVLAKAIQSLSKVGKELFIEADAQGLQMRTINDTQSAVGSIKFNRSMFETFQMPPSGDCCCKITMKSCLGVFRNMKQVEHCELSIVNNRTKFQVTLRCKLETMKQALLSIVDEQNITSAVATDQSANCIRGDYKLFMEISNSFIASEEELTLEAKTDSLSAKNYIEGARVNDKFMRSQLKLKPSEFAHYQVVEDAVITFCIKEFRAFLLFAEALNAEMTIEFDDAGSPFLLKIKKHEIECLLILSTLSPDDVSFSEDYCQRDIGEADLPSGAQKRKSSTPGPTIQQKRHLADNTTMETSGDSSLFQFREKRPPRPSEVPSVQPARLLAEGDTVDVVEEEADEEAMLLAVSEAAQASQVYPPNSTEVYFFETEEDHAPPTLLPPQHAEQEDEDEESIPQSPEREQRHKLRTIFSRCFQNTYVPREPSPNSQVYAPNSDTED